MEIEPPEDARARLVSIIIPTYNEEAALPLALKAVFGQIYPFIEVIVVDSHSKDKTKDIAAEFGAKVIDYDGKLLGARCAGFKASIGSLILLLDADQILEQDAVARAMEAIKAYDMLILEEGSYQPRTFVQKKLQEQRRSDHQNLESFNPAETGLLPRFFRRAILNKVFDAIPSELYPVVLPEDHSIIYYEAHKISSNVGFLPHAVSHIEPDSIYKVLKHNYRWGKASKALFKTGLYRQQIPRTFQKKNLKPALRTGIVTLAFLRSLAYQLGYYLG
jgi:glycosyltransferase involved in cell wall biosynthesis